MKNSYNRINNAINSVKELVETPITRDQAASLYEILSCIYVKNIYDEKIDKLNYLLYIIKKLQEINYYIQVHNKILYKFGKLDSKAAQKTEKEIERLINEYLKLILNILKTNQDIKKINNIIQRLEDILNTLEKYIGINKL